MTQIDSTAQTDLGISDHEELLLPYKAIYSQLLDTIKEVVSQTLDTAYHGTGAPHITTEVLELALKDNLSSLVTRPDLLTPVITKKERIVESANMSANIDPKILKMLQNNSSNPLPPPHPDSSMFSNTTSQLLKLIELNSLNSELSKSQNKTAYSTFLGYPSLHKPYSCPPLFKPRDLAPQTTSFSPLPKPFTPPLLSTPKIFSPGVIKSEDSPPHNSPQQAFVTAASKPLFSPSSPFTSVAKPNTSPVLSSTATSPQLALQQLHQSLAATSSPLASPLLASNLTTLGSASPLLSSSTTPSTLSNMEAHQNFIKQINLLNQSAPSMLGQKLGLPGSQDKPVHGDIEKVLMDIQVNLKNIKPDPWGQAKDKLYKCPHCETAFARRQYLSNHIINVHNLKTCPECKTTFSNEDAFNAHLALHPKKEYECGSCNKSFNSVYLLKNHRKTHVKDKPFACNICGKTFADKYYLRNHFSIHSPIKPYSCPVCGRGFASSSALRYHSFQHTGEKPAKCQYCPSEFVQKNQLKLHIARKHKDLIASLNPLHDGDIIPGNISLSRCSSPSQNPHHVVHTSPHTKVPSPISRTTPAVAIPPPKPIVPVIPTVSAPQEEAMQVDDIIKKPTKVQEPAPTVSMATEQLQELIASLQRSSNQQTTTTTANNSSITNIINA